MLSVQHNMLAWNANRQLSINSKRNTKHSEKLSSGYRINRSADDAAGLSISEKMRRQIRGLTQASTNAQDGISMVQSAEGALNEVHDMLHRVNELAIKAANGTLSEQDRAMVDEEVQQIKAEIDTVANHTVFNEINLFPKDGYSPKGASPIKTFEYKLSFHLADGSFQVSDAAGTTGAAHTGSADAAHASSADAVRAGARISSGSALADALANDLIPNAISQIFDAFPSFAAAQGGKVVDMNLNIAFVDGPGNTLALAGYSYSYAGGPPVSMYIKVDSADFTDADAAKNSPRAELLQSTIAHELMHSVMQYNLTDGMSGRNGEQYPTWFIEGTAQLSGGGYTTGWNNALLNYAGQMTDENDASQDAAIKNYLQQYTVNSRPYGHGYLASAYIGYLANGDGNVTGQGIAAGMDKVFDSLLHGKTLDQALTEHTGMNEAQIRGLFANGDNNLVEFTRKLSFNSKDGAGSVIAASLSSGGTAQPIIGTGAAGGAFQITQANVDLSGGSANVGIQVGADAGQHIEFKLYQMDTEALGLADINVKTVEGSDDTINAVKAAIGYVSNVRSYYGAVQNRLEHTINNLDNVVENTTAAESRIRDTDMATEMVQYSNSQILLQAGQSMLAQANHQSDYVLNLLG